jgi:hypothetical protein
VAVTTVDLLLWGGGDEAELRDTEADGDGDAERAGKTTPAAHPGMGPNGGGGCHRPAAIGSAARGAMSRSRASWSRV